MVIWWISKSRHLSWSDSGPQLIRIDAACGRTDFIGVSFSLGSHLDQIFCEDGHASNGIRQDGGISCQNSLGNDLSKGEAGSTQKKGWLRVKVAGQVVYHHIWKREEGECHLEETLDNFKPKSFESVKTVFLSKIMANREFHYVTVVCTSGLGSSSA